MNGLVTVEFLWLCGDGLTRRKVPYDGTKTDTLRFRVGKQNGVQHTVSG